MLDWNDIFIDYDGFELMPAENLVVYHAKVTNENGAHLITYRIDYNHKGRIKAVHHIPAETAFSAELWKELSYHFTDDGDTYNTAKLAKRLYSFLNMDATVEPYEIIRLEMEHELIWFRFARRNHVEFCCHFKEGFVGVHFGHFANGGTPALHLFGDHTDLVSQRILNDPKIRLYTVLN
jgi:hypothetical protein